MIWILDKNGASHKFNIIKKTKYDVLIFIIEGEQIQRVNETFNILILEKEKKKENKKSNFSIVVIKLN